MQRFVRRIKLLICVVTSQASLATICDFDLNRFCNYFNFSSTACLGFFIGGQDRTAKS